MHVLVREKNLRLPIVRACSRYSNYTRTSRGDPFETAQAWATSCRPRKCSKENKIPYLAVLLKESNEEMLVPVL